MLPKNAPGDNINLETSARAILNSPRTPQSSEAAHRAEERATTGLSSGYGTLSAWDTGLEPAQSPGDDQCEKRQKGKNCSLSNGRKDTETLVTGSRQHPNREETLKSKTATQLVHQQRAAGYVCGVCKGKMQIFLGSKILSVSWKCFASIGKKVIFSLFCWQLQQCSDILGPETETPDQKDQNWTEFISNPRVPGETLCLQRISQTVSPAGSRLPGTGTAHLAVAAPPVLMHRKGSILCKISLSVFQT